MMEDDNQTEIRSTNSVNVSMCYEIKDEKRKWQLQLQLCCTESWENETRK